MKNNQTFLGIAFCLILLAGSFSPAQDFSRLTVKKPAAVKVAKPDSCIGVSADGIKIYKGKKGGFYYLETSKRTGKVYRRYIKAE